MIVSIRDTHKIQSIAKLQEVQVLDTLKLYLIFVT